MMRRLRGFFKAKHRGLTAGWPANPTIYEINTWVWLHELSQKHNREISLANVPTAEIEALADWRFDAVWLMGVWHRGPASRQSALNYIHEYRQALPDISEDDIVGSAYAIHDYQVEKQLGGRAGLAAFREQLRHHRIRLVLDYVPNHVAADHAWIHHHPAYFIQGSAAEAAQMPQHFFPVNTVDGQTAMIAHGRDPYFPPWIDTAQLNGFHVGLRQAAIDTLIDIGAQCDGVRCDMAMLMMNGIFAKTWGERAGAAPKMDYWNEVIPAVRQVHPQMMFMAEVYWDLEHELQLQGFDYTYDKRMYDRLIRYKPGEIKAHLSADLSYLKSNIRFIENHDEPRAMSVLGEDRQRAAAALICTLPGAALLHQGQLGGRRIKLPVQISRQPTETHHPLLERFYKRLLREVQAPVYRQGKWRMLEARPAFEGSQSHERLIAYTWEDKGDYRLAAVNLGGEWARCCLPLPHWPKLAGHHWRLYDVLADSYTCRAGQDLIEKGLTLEIAPYGSHIFQFQRRQSAGF